MGTDIQGFLEYDDPNCAREPFIRKTGRVIPLNEYVELRGGKDYRFFAAISGFRSRDGESPLFQLRGLPSPVSDQVYEGLFSYHPTEQISWLSASEIHLALAHLDIRREELSVAALLVIGLMDYLSGRLGSPERVRFVFGIE